MSSDALKKKNEAALGAASSVMLEAGLGYDIWGIRYINVVVFGYLFVFFRQYLSLSYCSEQ